MKRKKSKYLRLLFAISCLIILYAVVVNFPFWEKEPAIGIGDAEAFKASYDQWQARYTRAGGDRQFVLSLGYSKGLSSEFTKAHGRMNIDLKEGSVMVSVVGLPQNENYNVWLVDNRPGPGHSVKPEPSDRMILLGKLQHEDGIAKLKKILIYSELKGFEIDLAVVTRANENPATAGLLFGSPSLFQKIYYQARGGKPYAMEDSEYMFGSDTNFPGPFKFLIPAPAFASSPTTDYKLLISLGEKLFFEDKFSGNGRTCSTCHRAEKNFTINAPFIATLPDNDPLFVAEFNPNLTELENPKLMRKLGMIKENLDGFANPAVMRSVPHTLSLSTTLTPPPDNTDILPGPSDFIPLQRTGWSGDGAPGSGTLREFAIGAIIQHYPKRLNRVAGVDFRLPTDSELDALEAFQLSLGRQNDLDLNSLTMKSEIAERGRVLFMTEDTGTPGPPKRSAGKCNTCHFNAGATLSPKALAALGIAPGSYNFNLNIGTQAIASPPADLIDPGNNPPDGGFGKDGPDGGPYGDGTFNIAPLIEAPDTGPYFHHNVVPILEEAMLFYFTPDFTNSPGGVFLRSLDFGRGIILSGAEVAQVSAFIRVLNTVENIKSTISYENRLMYLNDYKIRYRVFSATLAELNDAIKVLDSALLHPDAISHLEKARSFVISAKSATFTSSRISYLKKAIYEEQKAKQLMVEE
jgi:cytochrome c peroxidase